MKPLYLLAVILAVAALLSPALAQDPAVSSIYASPDTIDADNSTSIIHYSLYGDIYGHARLEVYDQNQGLVRAIDNSSLGSGNYSIAWDGTDGAGNSVPDGIYKALITYTVDTATVTAVWGSTGTAASQFKRPSAIAVDEDGYVYLAEYDNHRVQKFDASGRFLTQWGGYGSGDGQLKYPSGIAVSNGVVYVVDYGNARVQMFAAEDGGFMGKWGRCGSDEGQFMNPHGIAVGGDGSVYVADMGNNRVQKFGPTGAYVAAWGSRGKGDGQFLSPFDVAISGNIVYVTDIDSNTVQAFSTAGAFLGKWGTTGSGDGQFEGASGIDADNAGRVYVTDLSNSRVQEFDSGGSFITTWGDKGSEASSLTSPAGIDVAPDGSVYVADYAANSVIRFTVMDIRESATAYNETSVFVDSGKVYREYNITTESKPGYSTYIIAFNDSSKTEASTAAEDQIASLVSTYNGTVITTYGVVNGIAVNLPDDQAGKLRLIDNVKYVEQDQEIHALLDTAVSQINGDDVWATGYAGGGIKVAVIDSGIDGSHPDLDEGKIVAWADYVNGNLTPYDDNGHGTHCAGTIAGSGEASYGKYRGVAPDASLIGVKVLDDSGAGNASALISGIDWAVANDADIISLSLGGRSHLQSINDAVDNAIKAGVVVVVAAGNDGESGAGTICCPGDDPEAITVGAVDRDDQIAYFSSRGPNYDGSVKPDITNVGTGLVAARASGLSPGAPIDSYYTAMSGTSMATPMTAGTAALLLSANPDLTPGKVKEALIKTATKCSSTVPDNNYGYGRVDAMAALNYVLSGELPVATPVATPAASPSPDEGPLTIVTVAGVQGNNSWYRSPVNVTLTPQDKSSTGIKTTYYSFDNVRWYVYAAPLTLGEEGTTTINYFSVDNQSHVEPVKWENVRIDWTPPEISGGPTTQPLINGWYKGNVTVHFVANDSLSGLMSVTPDQKITSDGGDQKIIGMAMDTAGNQATQTVKLSVDNLPPVTSISLTGKASGEWFSSDVQVSFAAADGAGSGVKQTEYSLDGATWQPAAPFVINKEGSTTVYYRSIDQVGNIEVTKSNIIKVDKTPPAIYGGPLTEPGSSGWYKGWVTVHFWADDAGSGVAGVTPDIVMNAEGARQSVSGTAIDKAGNSATLPVVGINIDLNSPVTTCVLSGEGGNDEANAWYRSNVTVALSAKDGGSGVKSTEYRIGSGDWQPYQYPFTVSAEGVTTVYYRSTDNVGHLESEASRTIRIDRVLPAIDYTILTRQNDDGWYTDTVIVHFTATDDKSGIGSITPDIYMSTDGPNQTVTGYATDMAGNTNRVTTKNLSIDIKPPVTGIKLNATPTGDGWFNQDVLVSFTSFDNHGKGSNLTVYSFDNTNWVNYTDPFVISAEGVNTIYYRSYDNVSHSEPINARNVKIDKTDPEIQSKIAGGKPVTWNGEEWFTEQFTIKYEVTDSLSGIKAVTPDTLIATEGANKALTGTVSDKAGNTNSTMKTVNVDLYPPVTTCTVGGTKGNNSWYVSNVTVDLAATDGGGSGMNLVQYSYDNAAWNTYTSRLEITEEGNRTIYYRSIDYVGHVEPVKNISLKIDRTSPTISIGEPDREAVDGWYKDFFIISYSPADSISGVYNVTAMYNYTAMAGIANGVFVQVLSPNGGTTLPVFPDGVNRSVTFKVTDNAGNLATTTLNYSVDLLSPVTNCTLNGTKGKNGWNTSEVTVTLNASDGSGIGIDHLSISLDNENWSDVASPFAYKIEDDGITTVYYHSTDKLGHEEPVRSITVKVDKTSPVISPGTSIKANSDGWYNANLTVFANATDATSGLESVTPASIAVTSEGQANHVRFVALDVAGNNATYDATNINLDRTTPNTTLQLFGVAGPNGWYASTVTVRFSVAEATGAVYDTMFSFDNANWHRYENQFNVANDNTAIYYYSVDKAGNKEAVKSTTIRIDRTLPDITCSLTGTSDSPDWYRSNVTVAFNVTEGGPSGLNRANYSLDGYYWKPVETFTVSEQGVYDLQYRAMDNAGNLVTGEKMFGVLKTPPTVAGFTPGDGESGVFVDSPITVRFDGRINMSSLTAATFYLSDGGMPIEGIVQYNNSSVAEFRPGVILDGGKTYTFYVTTGVKDLAGNSLAEARSWSFVTGNRTSAGIEVPTVTPTPVPEPTLEPTYEPTIEPTAAPATTEQTLPGMLPIALAILALVSVAGVVVYYVVVIRKR